MKSFSKLPDGYHKIYSVDLQKDRKAMIFVNLLAIAIGVVFAVPMHFVVSVTELFSMEQGLGMYFLRFLAILVGMTAYIVLHELVHGIAMKICGTKKIKYGFTGLYAYAGSDDFYDKKSYIFIALAPIVLWGVVLAVINIFISAQWFWVVYMIQLMNLSGAAGDIYVTVKFSRMPEDILVSDCGVGMSVYSAQV